MVRTRGMKKKEEEPVEDVVPEDEEEEEKYAKKAEMAPPKKCQCCCMPCRCWYYLFCVLAIVGVLVYMTYYDWPEVDRSEWGLSEFSKEIFKNLRAKPTTNFRWELPALLGKWVVLWAREWEGREVGDEPTWLDQLEDIALLLAHKGKKGSLSNVRMQSSVSSTRTALRSRRRTGTSFAVD
jgi:hypothetical protein